MTDLYVNPTGKLEGVVKAPPSKSYTIRAIVASLLSEGISKIRDPLFSLDTSACIKISEKLGAQIDRKDWGLKVTGCGRKLKNPGSVLDTENSGTTIRIITGVASLIEGEVTLTGDESIQKRPIGELLDALSQLGVAVSSRGGFPPIKVSGPLLGGVCSIRGDISSQFISSLLMSAPYAHENVLIELSTPLKSRPYVDLTLSVLEKFKIRVENEDYVKFFIRHGQVYEACDYTVEGDYSSGAFLIAGAALSNSDVTVLNLYKDSKQADKAIIDILRKMGAKVDVSEDRVRIQGTGNLSGITMDLSDSPDLVPICAVLGALSEGRTVIENVGHARLKECDRIHAMAVELSKMGADITEKSDGLVIKGGNLKGGAIIESWNDHRIVMSMAVAGLFANGPTTIKDVEVVAVTFPDFIDVMNTLGAGFNGKPDKSGDN